CASWTRSAAASGPSTRSCLLTRSSARGHEGAPGTRWWNGSRSGLVAEADLDGGLPVRDLVAVDLPPDRLEFEPVEVTDRSGRIRDGVGYRGVGPVGRRPHDLDDVVDPLGHDDLLVPHGCASGPRHSTVRLRGPPWSSSEQSTRRTRSSSSPSNRRPGTSSPTPRSSSPAWGRCARPWPSRASWGPACGPGKW